MGETLQDYSKINRLAKLHFSEEAIFDKFEPGSTGAFKKKLGTKSTKAKRFMRLDKSSRVLNQSVDVFSPQNLSPVVLERDNFKYETNANISFQNSFYSSVQNSKMI